jgi:hypothetical protein
MDVFTIAVALIVFGLGFGLWALSLGCSPARMRHHDHLIPGTPRAARG